MKRLKNSSLIVALFLCSALQADVISLSLLPHGGALSGAPGQTVGWDYTLSSSADFLLVTSADYITATPIGAFADFISSYNFVVAGPAPETPIVTQAFDVLTHSGLGSYAIDAKAVVGALSVGSIRITYDLYSVSPNDPGFDSGADLLSSGNSLEATASVQVVPTGAVPEPAGYVQLGTIALVVFGWRMRRRWASRPNPSA